MLPYGRSSSIGHHHFDCQREIQAQRNCSWVTCLRIRASECCPYGLRSLILWFGKSNARNGPPGAGSRQGDTTRSFCITPILVYFSHRTHGLLTQGHVFRGVRKSRGLRVHRGLRHFSRIACRRDLIWLQPGTWAELLKGVKWLSPLFRLIFPWRGLAGS